jgi:hypothetical protein
VGVSDSAGASNFVLDFGLEEGILDGKVMCKGGLVVALQGRRILCDPKVRGGGRLLRVGERCSIHLGFHGELVGGIGGRKSQH